MLYIAKSLYTENVQTRAKKKKENATEQKL